MPAFAKSVLRWLFLGLGGVAVIIAGLVVWIYLQAQRTPDLNSAYVALGSSFASGPGISPAADGSPMLCGQSANNYARLVARKLRLSLTDMSCGGASTENVLNGGQFFQGPQLRGLSANTRLVTITIGGNDVYFIRNLIAMRCRHDPGWFGGILGFCKIMDRAAQERGFATLAVNLQRIVLEIRRRSPKAKVIFVGYLSVLPQTGTCERLGIGSADADEMRAVARRLWELTEATASREGALVLDAGALSKGHDACAGEPWISTMFIGGFIPVPLHPNQAGMQAVADALGALIYEHR